MTIGPAPMIMMVEMSVLFGIWFRGSRDSLFERPAALIKKGRIAGPCAGTRPLGNLQAGRARLDRGDTYPRMTGV